MSAAGWTLTGSSDEPGWLLLPRTDSEASRRAWVDAQAGALRDAWAHTWQPEHDHVIPAMLGAALARRRDEDALAFQLWPTNAALCLIVHAAVGDTDTAEGTLVVPAPAAGDLADVRTGDAVPYDSEGLGPGVHVPVVGTVAGATVVGAEFVFRSGTRVVAVSVEPTLPELLAILMPAIHGFVQSLVLEGPAGERFRAEPAGILGAAPADQWATA
ncbi:hypothetical protein N3K63_01130 [Microbacterium sp. W1N]|uniref:hypothetical protein n=1 Tax=Microbacterium festucae TaxID=2977531 RepID=UPI0021BE3F22|nr:hypothetical protein [Microbacterium festucae]MCT9818881.1 hypothetical protein [Microbacterium festucae]